MSQTNKIVIRIENCIDNCKSLIVLKIRQIYDVIMMPLLRHHAIIIVRLFGSYNNQKQKNSEYLKFPDFCTVLGCSNKIFITTSKRGETLSKLAWKLEVDIN